MNFSDFIYDNYEVLETAKTEEIRIHCPFCGDNKFHGYVNTTKNVFYCQHCHASPSPSTRGYTAFMFLVKAHGFTFKEVKGLLYGGSEIENIHALVKNKDLNQVIRELTSTNTEELEVLEVLEMPYSRPVGRKYVGVHGRSAWKFMFSRFGVKAERVCRQNNIRYCVSGDYAGRIILPVYRDKQLVYFQSRAFFPNDLVPKYKNPPHASSYLFFCTVPKADGYFILCEGYFDALALGNCAVAALGSDLTDGQFTELITLCPKRVVVCFDDDVAGRRGALKTCRRLRPYVNDVMVVLKMGREDPCSLGIRARERVEQHISVFDSTAEVLLEMFDT